LQKPARTTTPIDEADTSMHSPKWQMYDEATVYGSISCLDGLVVDPPPPLFFFFASAASTTQQFAAASTQQFLCSVGSNSKLIHPS
jgi:hypothetical protein